MSGIPTSLYISLDGSKLHMLCVISSSELRMSLTTSNVFWLVPVTEGTGSMVPEVPLLATLGSSDNRLLLEPSLLQARLAAELDALASGLEGLIGVALVLKGCVLCPLSSWNLVLSLNELQGKTTVNVPDNVAMHQPGTWIVSLKTDDSVTRGLKHCSVATRRVDEVEARCLASSESAHSCAKEREVVTVQMHRMSNR